MKRNRIICTAAACLLASTLMLNGCGLFEEDANPSQGAQITFSTTDINGNAYTSADIKDAKVVMVNLWEPWCGPCVGEMPELEKLYEEYQDEGFLIIGAYATEGQDEDVKYVIDQNNITYPIVMADKQLLSYSTDYVPTTYFMDGDGNVLSSESYVGSKSYEEWKVIIESFMK